VGLTPMFRQYLKIKEQHQDAILFFRLGDFYEMFFDDARTASRELEITLTGRDGGGRERVPMCGVPYHAAESYIARLIKKGFRVAICEQVEDPSTAKGIVRREVTRVITPGTVIEEQLLDEKKHNYLASISPGLNGYGLAFTDITTGTFTAGSFLGKHARSELMGEVTRLMPAEVILPLSTTETLGDELKLLGINAISSFKDEAFVKEAARNILKDHFGPVFEEINYADYEYADAASGALVLFVKETQKRDLAHIRRINFLKPGKYMHLDLATRRNLELTRSISEVSRKHTLIGVMDHTVTAMGGRLIRSWIEQPLVSKLEIELRLDAVEELVHKVFLRMDLKEALKNIYDLERLSGRISFGTANARDLVALSKSLAQLPALKSLLLNAESEFLKEIGHSVDLMADIRELLDQCIVDNPPLSLREGGIIKPGFNTEVDRLRSSGREAKYKLAGLEERERLRTGIKSLKVGFNKIFGYFIEITKSNLELVPEDYRRRQTLANAERYSTPELKEYEDLVIGAEERLLQLEHRLFNELREKLSGEINRIQNSAAAVAKADAIYSIAKAAALYRYVRPQISEDGRLAIAGGRHPVLERVMGPGEFVPNDTLMDKINNRLVLITGPNMAGKSTYMRQVALIVLMAQVGSFVPATSAAIPLVDRIFTRIGASDDIAGGKSTFMMEMNECQSIVTGATDKSLVIMDEVGRGTSTYDGISIARALVEYIHLKIGSRTLFSTHYHELTDLEQIPGIVNLNFAVKEDGEDIIFLRKLLPGKADRSYGIHVARLAGLPLEIIKRAEEVLKYFETIDETSFNLSAAIETVESTLKVGEISVISELRCLNVMDMTPLEAINKLYMLQRKLNKNN